MRTTIEMAREAGLRDCTCNGTLGCLERFTEIVRADERARMAEQPAQQALDKMAENARELGLDYEPAQPKYRRGDRLICLETEEYCVIHISGTDRQWVKFPDTHIGVYKNEQLAELFELLPKEIEIEQPAQQEPDYKALYEKAVQQYNDLAELMAEQPAPVQQEPVAASKKDAVFAASIEFIGTLTGMQPPPIEVAPAEIFKPFRDFTEKVCLIFATSPPAQRKPLTDEQIEDIWADCPADWDDKINVLTLARAIEAAHGIKENT